MGIAVSGNGSGGVPAGTSYLSQGDGRISQFGPSGTFVRAFGLGVLASGEDLPRAELRIDVDATAGSYRLRFETARGEGHISGTNQLTGLNTSFGTFHVGDGIVGTGIPAGTTVTAVGAGTLQLSASATSTGDPSLTGTETTIDIGATAGAGEVDAALEALPFISEKGGVDVEGGPGGVDATAPYFIYWAPEIIYAPEVTTLTGALPLSGGAATVKAEVVYRSSSYEICNASPPSNDICKFGFGNSHGVAVDPATGNLYVRDGRLIAEYSAVGKYIRSFGQETVFAGPDKVHPASAEQSIDIPPSVTGGTFGLDFGGASTGPLAYNATAAAVQSALEGLPSIGGGNVALSGGNGATAPYLATFTGALENNAEPTIAVDSSNLIGGSGSVSVIKTGASAFDICESLDTCYGNSGSGEIGGAFAEGPKGYVAVAPPGAPNAGNVIAADPENHRVQEFSPTGEFIRAFGFDVVAAGPDNSPGGGFEECKFGDACKSGSQGSAIGQFGSAGPHAVAVDSTGAIYTVESEKNFRVQKFSPQVGPVGLSASLFGSSGAPNGTSSENTPTEIAIGAADHVLVVKRFTDGATANCPDGGPSTEESRVQELSSDGSTVLDTHMTCNGLRAVTGVAYDAAHGTLVTSYNQQLGSDFPLYFVAPAPPPSANLESVEQITSTGAKLVGTVNPHSATSFAHPTTASYQAEYKLSSDSTWTPYLQGTDAGAGSNDVPATAFIEGLTPNRSYDVRLTATKQYRQGKVSSAPQTFTTLPAAPEVSSFYTTAVSETGADLHAVINPFGETTKYRFEYGLTPDFGTTAPMPDGELQAVQGPQHVVVHVDGLNGGTYYFRVVAENDAGTTTTGEQTFNYFPPDCPNSLIRQQTGGSYLPDCRAYELVSAPNAGNVTLGAGGPFAPEATSPARFAYTGELGTIEGSGDPTGTNKDLYVATRHNDGWTTRYVGVPGTQTAVVGGPRDLEHFFAQGLDGIRASTDLSEVLDWDQGQGAAECCGLLGSLAPYMWTAEGASLGRLPTNLGEIPGATLDVKNGGFYGGTEISPDFKHYFFSSIRTAFTDDGLITAPGSAYDNDISNGTVTLISKTEQGGDIPAGIGGVEEGGEEGSEEFIRFPGVSADGSHVLMSTRAAQGTKRLYMAVNDVHHYNVSVGQDGLAHPVTYAGMTADGSTVYFASTERLSAEDTDNSADLYMWNENAPGEVTLISVGNGDSCGASWTSGCSAVPIRTGVVSDNAVASQSGDIYFTSPEQLVEGDGTPGQRNLFVYTDGALHFVTTLTGTATVDRIQVSPQGDHLAFMTSAALTPLPTGGHREMYTYDPDTGEIQCVSCIPDGTVPANDVEGSLNGLFMSDDGRTFFSTADSLEPQDTDRIVDSYEFVHNRPQLLSSGTADRAENTGFVGVSANGVDAYFMTRESFVGQDVVGPFVKFYDARVGGGIPFTPSLPPCEAADECHGPASESPAQIPTGTSPRLGNGGNLSVGVSKKHKRHKKTRKNKKKRSAHHG